MIHIVVEGPRPRKNARGPVPYLTPKRTKAWRARYSEAMADLIRTQPPAKLARSGTWTLRLDVYEDEWSHLDVKVPRGDIDSTITAVLDAMQKGHWAILDDDARVLEATMRKHYDKARPRVEITLTEIAEEGPKT